MVVIVCLSGVLFSGYQLWKATAPAPVGGSVDKSNADPLATNVELSWQNVRVTSSVIGLVVLVISVAYLYLFLKELSDRHDRAGSYGPRDGTGQLAERKDRS